MAHPYAWFGKLPTLGDFTEQGMTPELRQCWDQHLSGWMLNGQNFHGSNWIETYLSTPVFSFYSGSQCELSIKGKHSAGIMMPSVDKSGRFFPFVVLCALVPQNKPGTPTVELNHWFFQLRKICSAALYEDWSLAQLGGQLEQLATPTLIGNEPDNPAHCQWHTIDQHGKLGNAYTREGFPAWSHPKAAMGRVCQ